MKKIQEVIAWIWCEDNRNQNSRPRTSFHPLSKILKGCDANHEHHMNTFTTFKIFEITPLKPLHTFLVEPWVVSWRLRSLRHSGSEGHLLMFHELNADIYVDSMHSENGEHSELHHNSKCGGWAHHIIKPSDVRWKSWMCQSLDSRIPHKCNAKSSSIHLALTLDPGPLSTGRYNCDRVPHNRIFAQSLQLTLLLLASCQHAAGIRFAGVLCWEFKGHAQRQGQPEIEGNLESIIANTRSNTSNTWRLSGWLLVENFNCGCKNK